MIREASQLVDPREYNRSQFDGLVSQLSKQINFNKGDIRVLDLFDEPTVSVGSVSAPLNGYQNLGFLEVKISIPQEMPSIKLFNNGRDISIIVKSYQDFVVLSNGDNSLIEAIYPYGSLVMYCFKEKE